MIRTDADIRNLKGQEESIRLEFKSGKLFEKPKDKWVDDLSREVSAFANTEGGELILGLPEEKQGKIKVASEPDGVPNSITKSDLQRLIEDNLRPYLPGIHYYRIPISSITDRAVWVIEIPAGKTAYQAKDCVYYGRSEVEVKPLRDDVIRLRMERGKVASARIEARITSSRKQRVDAVLESHGDDAIELFKENRPQAIFRNPGLNPLLSIATLPDTVSLHLFLVNDGELTIRDPLCRASIDISQSARQQMEHLIMPSNMELEGLRLTNKVIYPEDETYVHADFSFQFKDPLVLNPDDFVLTWKVFLDNSPSHQGEIDLGRTMQQSGIVDAWKSTLEKAGLLDSIGS